VEDEVKNKAEIREMPCQGQQRLVGGAKVFLKKK
jgi:hypothetical protein